jgi:hypothetical protein
MGKTYELLTPALQEWITAQNIFFVATAPLAAAGHLNCSPKGGDSLRILNDRQVAYLDLTGSGVETIAHVRENSRLLIMFCAFIGPPQIVRLYGQGEVITPDHPDFTSLATLFPAHPGTRSIIRSNLTRITDSCGYAVPLMDYVKDRDILDRWAETKGPDGVTDYQQKNNLRSIDGLPGVDPA